MAYVKGEPFKPQFMDYITGRPMAGGTIEFYLEGTSTPTPYYTDDTGTLGGTSLTLTTGGVPATDIYYDNGIIYKIVVKDDDGSTMYTIPDYVPNGLTSATGTNKNLDYVANMTADASATAGDYYILKDYASGRNAGPLYFNCLSGTGTDDGGSVINHDTLNFRFEQVWVKGVVSTKGFGLPTGGDDYARLQAFFYYCETNSVAESEIVGDMLTSQGLTWTGTGLERCELNVKITATEAITIVLSITNVVTTRFIGRLKVWGTGGVNYSERTCDTAIHLSLVSRAKFDFIDARNAKSWGIDVSSLGGGLSNNLAELGLVRAKDCGTWEKSGSGAVTANWSNIVNNGSSGSVTQTTTIDVDNLPPEVVVDDMLIINSELYHIRAVDSGAGTVDVHPWIDNTIGSAGTLAYVIGGGIRFIGNDTGLVSCAHADTTRCGVGIRLSSLYNPLITGQISQFDLIAVLHGSNRGSANKGGVINGVYAEGGGATDFDFVKLTNDTDSGLTLNGHYTDGIAKNVSIGPRYTSNKLNPVYESLRGIIFGYNTGQYEYKQAGRNSKSSTQILYLESKDPSYWVVSTAPSTWTLTHADDFNRLFGHTAIDFNIVGDSNPALTLGAQTLQLDATDAADGWTVMGGATYVVNPTGHTCRIIATANVDAKDWRISVYDGV